ncbi:MAG TPA: hypothetical protein VFU45_07030 [Gemmatimonadales bacterium]|nr:hypothetical protein [Gemmatimonadales bacterium]
MLQAIPPVPAPPSPAVFMDGPPVSVVLITVVVVVAGVIFLYPLVRAWARRLEGGVPRDDSDLQLGARVEHLEQRLADAEERLDFAERMLARGPETAALPREKAD